MHCQATFNSAQASSAHNLRRLTNRKFQKTRPQDVYYTLHHSNKMPGGLQSILLITNIHYDLTITIARNSIFKQSRGETQIQFTSLDKVSI